LQGTFAFLSCFARIAVCFPHGMNGQWQARRPLGWAKMRVVTFRSVGDGEIWVYEYVYEYGETCVDFLLVHVLVHSNLLWQIVRKTVKL
jgi:hypothetical protein